MTNKTCILYLHGFASSPRSNKARVFTDRWTREGREAVVPDLNEPDFSSLTVSRILERTALEAGKLGRPYVVMGSSLGGYAAALHAQKPDPNLRGVILMAPAFDFFRRYSQSIDPATLAGWRERGSMNVMHYDLNREVPLKWDIMADCEKHAAFPDIADTPCLILHGTRDDVVPPDLSRRFAAVNPGVRLHFLDGGHDLAEPLPQMLKLVDEFLKEIDQDIDNKGL